MKHISIEMIIGLWPVDRNFQRGFVDSHCDSTPREARCYCGRSPGVFGAKSCNLGISRYFILTFGKSCFSKLIFKYFHQILDFISHSLNKPLLWQCLFVFKGGGECSYEPLDPPPLPDTGMGLILGFSSNQVFFKVHQSKIILKQHAHVMKQNITHSFEIFKKRNICNFLCAKVNCPSF